MKRQTIFDRPMCIRGKTIVCIGVIFCLIMFSLFIRSIINFDIPHIIIDLVLFIRGISVIKEVVN